MPAKIFFYLIIAICVILWGVKLQTWYTLDRDEIDEDKRKKKVKEDKIAREVRAELMGLEDY